MQFDVRRSRKANTRLDKSARAAINEKWFQSTIYNRRAEKITAKKTAQITLCLVFESMPRKP
jgi:predicted CoA-binding protein